MKEYLVFVLLFATTLSLPAQNGLFSITYDLSLPLGETADVVDNFSWRGATLLDGRALINDRISVGGSLGWHVFTSKEYGTYTRENQTGTGTLVQTINALPILANVHYYVGSEFEANPYFGLGIGTASVTTRTEFGLFAEDRSAWEFALVPQAGILVPLGYSVHGHVKLSYNYAFQAGEAIFNTNYLSLGIGLAWYQ